MSSLMRDGQRVQIRSVYATDHYDIAGELIDDAIEWCTAVESGPELRCLAKMLRRWRTEIIAHHVTGASYGPVEAANPARQGREAPILHRSRASDPAIPGWSRSPRNRD